MKKVAIFTVASLVLVGTVSVGWSQYGALNDGFGSGYWGNSRPERFSGSSQQLGPFRYDNFWGDRGTQIHGFGQRLGQFQFDTFHDNRGNTTNCTTHYIGQFAFTNCY
jgi:hypothetical protein